MDKLINVNINSFINHKLNSLKFFIILIIKNSETENNKMILLYYKLSRVIK